MPLHHRPLAHRGHFPPGQPELVADRAIGHARLVQMFVARPVRRLCPRLFAAALASIGFPSPGGAARIYTALLPPFNGGFDGRSAAGRSHKGAALAGSCLSCPGQGRTTLAAGFAQMPRRHLHQRTTAPATLPLHYLDIIPALLLLLPLHPFLLSSLRDDSVKAREKTKCRGREARQGLTVWSWCAMM